MARKAMALLGFAALLVALAVPVAIAGPGSAEPAGKASKQLKRLKKQVKRLKTQVKSVRSSVGELDADAASLAARVAGTEGRLGTAEASLDGADSRLGVAEGRIGTVEGGLTASGARIDALEASRDAIQSGETLTGTFVTAVPFTKNGVVLSAHESFLRRAPVALTAGTVHIDGVDEVGNPCTGTRAEPTASPGHVCLYPEVGGLLAATAAEGKGNSPYGFTMQWTTTGAGTLDQTGIAGNWAYTAP